jgi:hypothetical protein
MVKMLQQMRDCLIKHHTDKKIFLFTMLMHNNVITSWAMACSVLTHIIITKYIQFGSMKTITKVLKY